MRYDTYLPPAASPNPGKAVFLLGLAEDGPINTPVPVRSVTEAETIFGAKDQGDLVRAFEEAALVEGNTIYLMRVTGEYARNALLIQDDARQAAGLTLRAIKGGERYNELAAYIGSVIHDGTSKQALVIESPSSIGSGRAYVLDHYPVLSDLVHEINLDGHHGQGFVYAATEYPHLDTQQLIALNQQPAFFKGGRTGLDVSKDDLYIALAKSYEMLVGRDVDVICPVSARLDDTHPAFYYGDASYGTAVYGKGDHLALIDTESGDRLVTYHEQLIDFCREQERFGIMTHGVIGLREQTGTNAPAYIGRLVQATALKNRYGLMELRNGEWHDHGFYISIFGHDFVYDSHTANGCATYAAMIGALGEDESTTNQMLPENAALAFELTPDEIRDLAAIGVTTARTSVTKGAVISNGITAALYNTALHSIANVRMVQQTIRETNAAISNLMNEPFIPVVTEREVTNRVEAALESLKTRGVLKEYTFRFEFDANSEAGAIHLEITPRYTIEAIATVARISFNEVEGGLIT